MEELTVHQLAFAKIETWPLMVTSVPIVTLALVYLLFVLKIGPKFMDSRKPFNLTNFTRIYNVLQLAACTAFVTYAYTGFGFKLADTWTCIPLPMHATDGGQWMKYKSANWWFMVLRLVEFVETVVFVLRKKQNQVSVLHVYHHISTVVIVWLNIRYSSTWMDMHHAIINSMVHIVMYTYYFLSSFKSIKLIMRKTKPFVTSTQLVQLVVIIGHSVIAVLPTCNGSLVSYLQVINIGILIGLFINFYIQSYVKRKQN